MVRRLPVLNSDAGPQRPGWHWVLIGLGLTLTSWLPLLVLALAASRYFAAELSEGTGNPTAQAVVPAALFLLSHLVACTLGAFLVCRFGGEGAPRHARLGNLATVFVALLLAILGGVSGGAVLIAGLALCLSAWVGSWLGRRGKP